MSGKENKKVICAMSGGVDSSVAAALLKRAGFDLVGVFMKFWSESEEYNFNKRWNKCCSPDSERRARKVADSLSIPFYVIDLRKEFKKKVVDYFLREYKQGKTPNPCIVCNKEIKFGLLFKKAFSLGFNYIATGHYAIKREIKDKKSSKVVYKLFRAKDKAKDQSYFLWKLGQKELSCILFPLGRYTKKEVKKLAKKFRLPVFDIPESQEICFISDNLNDFLARHIRTKTGKIVDTKGKELGRHQGLAFYTIGQRKGIKLPGGPYYVASKNTKENILVVSKNKKDLLRKELLVEDVNWISEKTASLPLEAKVKIRYRHKGALAIIKSYKKGCLKIIFSSAQEAVTPGQSAVFYKGEEVLGGGIIC